MSTFEINRLTNSSTGQNARCARIFPVSLAFCTKMTEPNIDLKGLQKRFAEVDLLHRAENSSGLEFLVLQLAETKVRIYKEQNHARPHFHIEYKKIYSASYTSSHNF